MYVIDPLLSVEVNMQAMFRTLTDTEIVGDEFTYGLPTAQTPADPRETTNTVITLTAVEGKGYEGVHKLRYRRAPLGQTYGPARMIIPITAQMTRGELLGLVVQEHHLVPSEVLFSGVQVMPAPGQDAILTVSAYPTSLLYVGSMELTIRHPL